MADTKISALPAATAATASEVPCAQGGATKKVAVSAAGAAVLEAANATAQRVAMGAGTSSFSGAYADLSGKPTLGTAAAASAGDFDAAGAAAAAQSAAATDATTKANAAQSAAETTAANALAVKKLDDLAAPDDNTDLNASTATHGLCPKLDNDITHFLNGQGGFTTPLGGSNWIVKHTDYTAVSGDRIIHGVTAGATVYSLPASPSEDAFVFLAEVAGSSVVTVDANGSSQANFTSPLAISPLTINAFLFRSGEWVALDGSKAVTQTTGDNTTKIATTAYALAAAADRTKLTPEASWGTPQSGGDKTVTLTDYDTAGLAAAAALVGLGDTNTQVGELTSVLQALITYLRAQGVLTS